MSCRFIARFSVTSNLPNNEKNHLTAFWARNLHQRMGCDFKLNA